MKRIFFVLWCLMAISACKNETSEEEESHGKTVFRYNEAFGISSLDPAFARNFENIAAINQLFNGLVQMNEKLQVIPCIAKRWEISEDGLVYTFYLRDDVYFHDHELFKSGKGRKATASDFVHSFYRIIDPKIASPGAWIFNDVDLSKKSNYSGFVAPDDTTLQIYLKNPFPPFLSILTMQYCSVIPHEIVEYYGDDFRNNPVGTGPFKFKNWKESIKLVMVKNENYFEKDGGEQLPYIDAISISFIKERQSEFMSFVRGDFDLLSGIDGIFKDELLTLTGELNPAYKDQFIMQSIPFLKTDYMGILVDENLENVKKSPLKYKAVRQAINYGFNREEMIKFLRNNIGTPASAGFVPQGMPSFDSTKVKGYYYDPEKARELLFQAGFPNGEGLSEITLSTTAMYQDLSEFIQKQLAVIGIKIKLDVLPAAIHTELTARSALNFFRKSWVADYPDAENYFALFYSKNFCPEGPNYTHFSNKIYDQLYEKAKSEINDSIRYELYHKMDNIIIEESPIVPLYYDQAVRFYPINVTGIEINPMNLLTLKRVKKA